MASGNLARNRPKGFHVSADACEMLEQLVIVVGKSESFWVDEGIRELFIQKKREYSQSFGADYWAKVLDSMLHTDKLMTRRRILRSQE